jgi:acyl-CoA reductase-like NAD-dependent aldehyde dehydrogenase
VFPVTIGATVVPAMIANKKFHGGITTVTPVPVIAAKFVEVLEESGLPKGVVNFVPGSGAEVGDYLTIGATVVPAMIANKKFHGGITTVTPVGVYTYWSGLPKGVVNFVPGSGAEVGDYLVDHPKTSLITFTGSRRF